MAKTLFLGVEGAGKTTLAMALVRAFARHRGEGWYLRPVDRGAYSFAAMAPDDFARDGFPRQTASVREMSWEIERHGEAKGGLVVLDYPGEIYRLAFLDVDDEPDPVAFRERTEANAAEIATLRSALAEASRVFVLFNLQDALDLRNSDAGRGAVWVTNESLKAAKAQASHPEVALVFTQVDRYQTADDFLHTFTPRDLDLVGHDHPDIDWAMVSVLVPPESEFGVDAFVRRCTGLPEFGVPDGRPVDAAAARAGDALSRLAAAKRIEVESPVVTRNIVQPPAATEESRPPEAKTSSRAGERPWMLLLAALAGGLVMLVLVRHLMPGPNTPPPIAQPRGAEPLRGEQIKGTEPFRGGQNKKSPTAISPSESVQIPVSNVVSPEAKSPVSKPVATPTPSPSPTPALSQEEIEKKVVDMARRHQENEAAAKRLAAAAWCAWEKAERAREEARKVSGQRLIEALASASPQDAHEALCDAAEAGNPQAQERLARVYDIWGWGGWVRTKEEAGARWTDWLRRIDFEKGSKAVLVSRVAPNAEEFRKLALTWYRSAASNGVESAAEALKRHEAQK